MQPRVTIHRENAVADEPAGAALIASADATRTPSVAHEQMGMGAEDYCACGLTWPHARHNEPPAPYVEIIGFVRCVYGPRHRSGKKHAFNVTVEAAAYDEVMATLARLRVEVPE